LRVIRKKSLNLLLIKLGLNPDNAHIMEHRAYAIATVKVVRVSLKLKIYTTLIRPAVTCETWILTCRNEQQLIFEREILRKIFGPTKDENGVWKIRKKHELNELVGNADTQ